jgi:hypothetical protein
MAGFSTRPAFQKQLLDAPLEEALVSSVIRLIMAMNPEIQPSQSQKDQRRHARLDIALAVNYAIQQAGPDGVYGASEMAETLSSDISASGLRLMTVAPLDNGSILNLEITLPRNGRAPRNPSRPRARSSGRTRSPTTAMTGTVIKYMEENEKKRLMSCLRSDVPSGAPSPLPAVRRPAGGTPDPAQLNTEFVDKVRPFFGFLENISATRSKVSSVFRPAGRRW